MDLEALTDRVRQAAPQLAGLGYKVKFALEDGGLILVDGTAMPPAVSNEEGEADTTIRITPANLEKLLDGALNPTLAYTLGKLKIDGSVGVALKLASMLES
jgi:putative sterol carrier protein